MDYKLQIKEQIIDAEVTLKPDQEISATLGTPAGEIRHGPVGYDQVGYDQVSYDQVSYDRISDHQIRLVVDGQQVMAWIGQEPDGKTIFLGGERFFIRDTDKPDQTQTRRTARDMGPAQVTPPMPAVVMCVPVKLGNRVEKGDIVVVVSAMKMETSLTAPHGGIITRVGVTQGDKVMPGDILMDIDQTQPLETTPN